MNKRPIGSFAQATFDSIRRAEQLQAASLQYIHSEFESEPELESLEDLTWEAYKAELSGIKTDEQMVAFNAKLAALITPFIQQAMQSEQPQ